MTKVTEFHHLFLSYLYVQIFTEHAHTRRIEIVRVICRRSEFVSVFSTQVQPVLHVADKVQSSNRHGGLVS